MYSHINDVIICAWFDIIIIKDTKIIALAV